MNTVKAPAKINLNLRITWVKEDAYHLLDSDFLKIGLFDEINFEDKNSWIEIRTSWEFRRIPTNSGNSCYKAAKLMQRYSKLNKWIKISIKKNIPLMSWLWWWSSNAAEVIKYLNTRWDVNFDIDRLTEIWKIVWADIPFFLHEKQACNVKGIWEIVSGIENPHTWHFVALFQLEHVRVDTAWAYSQIDKFYRWKWPKWENINAFEKVIFDFYPDLLVIKNSFLNTWATHASLTGCWSVVYWIFEKKSQAENALWCINQKGWRKVVNIF